MSSVIGATAMTTRLTALSPPAATTARPLDELDWHRILDVIILVNRA
jgi:hypothetical protein